MVRMVRTTVSSQGDRDIFEAKSQNWTGGDVIAHAKMEWRERVYLKMLTSTG